MKVKLGQLCKINPKSQHIPEDTNVSFVPMSCISEEGRIDASQVCPAREVSKGYTAFAEGDILMAKITPCMENGKGAIAEGLCNGLGFGSTEFHVLRADLSRVSPNWLFRFTKSEKFRRDCAGNMTGSGGQKRVPKSYLEKYSVNLPSLARQREIVRVLDKVEAVIDKHKRQLAKLDELARARFVEMFGDPVSNSKKLGILPIAELAEVKIGPFGSLLHQEDYIVGGHPIINPMHIVGGEIIADSNFSVDEETYNRLSSYQVCVGDVILARRGEMGRCGLVKSEGMLCGTGSLIIRPGRKISGDYLQRVLSFPTFRSVIERKAVGQTMLNLNSKIVSSITIPVPNSEVQRQFAEFVTHIERMKRKVRASLEATQKLLGSLMQEYFS